MALNEYLGNVGYLAYVPETTKGTPLTPTSFLPIYDETLSTNGNLIDLKPIAGQKFNTFATVQGQRSHKGDITTLAEPNSTAYFQDIFMTSGAPTGSNPYTRSATFSTTQNPRSNTWDICRGQVVSRYWGVEISKWTPNWNSNELQHKLSISALGSFQNGTIASITGSGPYTVVLDATYDPNPTTGLVAADLIRFYDVSADTYIDTTITAITNGTTFTTAGAIGIIVAGDLMFLRPQTPVYSPLPSFLWSNTYFGFGATASAALAAATASGQVRVEKSSTWELDHKFESDDGAARSGGFDPAALVRTMADATLTIKKAFKNSSDIAAFNQLSKSSVAIRHTAGATRQYEWTIIFNNVKTDTPVGNIKFGEIVYSTIKFHPNYDITDGQAVSTTTVSAKATLT